MRARIYNWNAWVDETDPQTLLELFEDALAYSNFHVINRCSHDFEPQGHTSIWLLSESHLALHTFPERRKSYVELSSCVLDQFDRFLDYVQHVEATGGIHAVMSD